MRSARAWSVSGLAAAVLVLAAGGLLPAGRAQTPVVGLRPPDAFARIGDREERAAALFSEMGKVIQHPRCMNCHPRGDSPTQREGSPHAPPVLRGPRGHGVAGLECGSCHGAANVTFANGEGSVPGHPDWHLAPREMAWQGRSPGEICAQIKDRGRNGDKNLSELLHHNAEDGLVGWGWNPGEGRAPAPGTQRMFGELTRAWIEAGATCPDP